MRPDVDLGGGLIIVQRQVIWRRKKDCPEGEPHWALVEPKSKAGIRMVEIPEPMQSLVAAHLETLNGIHNPLDLVFPSSVAKRSPALKALTQFECAVGQLDRHVKLANLGKSLRQTVQHAIRRKLIALHVAEAVRPKLAWGGVGRGGIGLAMNGYGKLAGRMRMEETEQTRFNALAHNSLPADTSHLSTPIEGPHLPDRPRNDPRGCPEKEAYLRQPDARRRNLRGPRARAPLPQAPRGERPVRVGGEILRDSLSGDGSTSVS